MKKIFSFVIIFFLLSSCFTKEDTEVEPKENNNTNQSKETPLKDTKEENSMFQVYDLSWTVMFKNDAWETKKLSIWDNIPSLWRIMALSDSSISIVFKNDNVLRLSSNTSLSIEKELFVLNNWFLWFRVLDLYGDNNLFKIKSWDLVWDFSLWSFYLTNDNQERQSSISYVEQYFVDDINMIDVEDEKTNEKIKLSKQEQIVKNQDSKSTKIKFKLRDLYRDSFVKKSIKEDILYMSKLIEKKLNSPNIETNISYLDDINLEIKKSIPSEEDLNYFFFNQELFNFIKTQNIILNNQNIFSYVLKDLIIDSLKKENDLDKDKTRTFLKNFLLYSPVNKNTYLIVWEFQNELDKYSIKYDDLWFDNIKKDAPKEVASLEDYFSSFSVEEENKNGSWSEIDEKDIFEDSEAKNKENLIKLAKNKLEAFLDKDIPELDQNVLKKLEREWYEIQEKEIYLKSRWDLESLLFKDEDSIDLEMIKTLSSDFENSYKSYVDKILSLNEEFEQDREEREKLLSNLVDLVNNPIELLLSWAIEPEKQKLDYENMKQEIELLDLSFESSYIKSSFDKLVRLYDAYQEAIKQANQKLSPVNEMD